MTEEVAPSLRVSIGLNMAIVTLVAMISTMTYYSLSLPFVEIPYTVSGSSARYVYESDFAAGELGALNTSYWVVDPLLVSGTHYIENGMLKIESNSRYQIGFGMKWISPTYEKGDCEPWLPVFWRYHLDAIFAGLKGGEIPTLIIENWIACETGKSITAMIWYQHGNLMYSYGAFPNDLSYGILLGHFIVASEFTVTVNADYWKRSMTVDWSGHSYSVPLQVERIGAIPRPFTHFQITLMEPGAVLIKNLQVVLSNS